MAVKDISKRAFQLIAAALLATVTLLTAATAPAAAFAAESAQAPVGSLRSPLQAASSSSLVSVTGAANQTSIANGAVTVEGLDSVGAIAAPSGYWYEPCFMVTIASEKADSQSTVTIASSNPNLIAVKQEDASRKAGEAFYGRYVYLEVKGTGMANVTVACEGDSVTFPVIVYPTSTDVTSVSKATYDSASVSWKKTAGATGYIVQRSTVGEYGYPSGDYKIVAKVSGEAVTKAKVKAPWNTEYAYRVLPCITYKDTDYCDDAVYSSGAIKTYALPEAACRVTSVKTASSKYMNVAWSADMGASKFELMRSTSENYGFKTVKSVAADTTSFTDKSVKKGVTYYYKVRATYPSYGAVTSNTWGHMIAKKTSVLRKAAGKVSQEGRLGSYYWYWASSDNMFYFTQGSRLYCACYTGKALKVYGFNSKLKRVSTKTVKLPKHEVWGGFYHGPDGNNYVAVGYNNRKESKTKTVVKVVKYSSSWKKGKTAAVKGGASNVFTGIFEPFSGGTPSFEMLEDGTLILHMSRTMFQTSDGLHHQSNITFAFNTKRMKLAKTGGVYSSHSFNQRVKAKDGTVYYGDHGDAYARAITVVGKAGNETTTISADTFEFMGTTGDNFTGATMGGMEIGKSNVLVCGTAQPHGYKVAGVKGFGSYRQNVFVTVTNRTTGKSSVKWLTSINPAKGKQSVGETRMVKLTDDRFAIMYSITNDSTGKSTLYYTVVNDAGKKVLTKKYSNMSFVGASQPVLSDGSIVWMECSTRTRDVKSTLYRIPALM